MDFYTLSSDVDFSLIAEEVMTKVAFVCQPEIVGSVFEDGSKFSIRFAVRNDGLAGQEGYVVEVLSSNNFGIDSSNTVLVKADRI